MSNLENTKSLEKAADEFMDLCFCDEEAREIIYYRLMTQEEIWKEENGMNGEEEGLFRIFDNLVEFDMEGLCRDVKQTLINYYNAIRILKMTEQL